VADVWMGMPIAYVRVSRSRANANTYLLNFWLEFASSCRLSTHTKGKSERYAKDTTVDKTVITAVGLAMGLITRSPTSTESMSRFGGLFWVRGRLDQSIVRRSAQNAGFYMKITLNGSLQPGSHRRY
jgi:hypothetical protein